MEQLIILKKPPQIKCITFHQFIPPPPPQSCRAMIGQRCIADDRTTRNIF